MKKYQVVLAFILAGYLPLRAQEVPSFTKAVYVSGTDSLPYRLLYPLHYDQHKKYPIVLFLHGAGQRGKDNESPLAGVPQALTDPIGREKYPCFILVPQCAKKDVWVKFPGFPESLQATDLPTPSARAAFAQLDILISQLPIDKKRVYIMGYSMGGEGTFDFLTRQPELFAAAIPICSVSDTAKARLIHKIPVWAFHGDQDEVNNVRYSRMMIGALKKQGGKPIYTEFPGAKHNIWMQAYSQPGLFDWLFAQKRP
ncbi:prolyl oligopeptidase family serine peptidase [Mucilaginibacter mali]|uniref:Prolyl oligopeptidase family serine peptidase n=1 Tax=Mucilaginibacter mali TaxID=2740462 RepID=A0A7D4Q3J3_9SPHI|nr:prolyl oligopeptidase family serine peptidase [Mucilaginibacter mali]QKJ32226.1 prolyl oligopeptidase family serine peptidase [Mucilaginibacter mali]